MTFVKKKKSKNLVFIQTISNTNYFVLLHWMKYTPSSFRDVQTIPLLLPHHLLQHKNTQSYTSSLLSQLRLRPPQSSMSLKDQRGMNPPTHCLSPNTRQGSGLDQSEARRVLPDGDTRISSNRASVREISLKNSGLQKVSQFTFWRDKKRKFYYHLITLMSF